MPPRLSTDYGGGITDASLSALLELSLTLNSYRDALVLVGGWAPFFLIEEFGRGGFPHVGSIDIDIAVNPELVRNDEYASNPFPIYSVINGCYLSKSAPPRHVVYLVHSDD